MEISGLICPQCLTESSLKVRFMRSMRMKLVCNCGTVFYPNDGRAAIAFQAMSEIIIQVMGLEKFRELVHYRMASLRSQGSPIADYKAPVDTRTPAPKKMDAR